MLDTDILDKAVGKSGQNVEGIYKFSLPRTDLSVSIDGITLRPGLALGSWIAFKPTPQGAITHGDLVLREGEVGPVVRQLEQEGIMITALHNHLVRESPKMMYLHFWGEGKPETLASSLRAALNRTKTPIEKAEAPQGESISDADLQAEEIQKVLGRKGKVKGGVLSISVARPEAIKVGDIELPPNMGMATALNFQAADRGKVAATGDFVMTEGEVNTVSSALAQHGIEVTALHNHLVHPTPNLYFMHFWAHDTPEKVAKGLEAGLEAMKGKR